ncbi:unnamed protein product, partial [Ectocarpus sp. 12 AP-2014]
GAVVHEHGREEGQRKETPAGLARVRSQEHPDDGVLPGQDCPMGAGVVVHLGRHGRRQGPGRPQRQGALQEEGRGQDAAQPSQFLGPAPPLLSRRHASR